MFRKGEREGWVMFRGEREPWVMFRGEREGLVIFRKRGRVGRGDVQRMREGIERRKGVCVCLCVCTCVCKPEDATR